jgi:hypothetical protein
VSDYKLGKKIVPPPAPEPVAEWIPHKPGFVKHSITGQIATDIAKNEAANNPPPIWPNYGPVPIFELNLEEDDGA